MASSIYPLGSLFSRPRRKAVRPSDATGHLLIAAVVALVATLSAACSTSTIDPSRARPKRPPVPSLRLDTNPASLANSVHAKVDCKDCHVPVGGADASDSERPPVDCDHCHQAEAKAYHESIHGLVNEAKGKAGKAARCQDCHGAHDIVKVDDPRSRVFKMRLPFTCAVCHQNPGAHEVSSRVSSDEYMDSMHGRGLLTDGLIVAPSCVDCHGASHNIKRANDPTSPINHANVPKTCGKCHVGVEEVYDKSIHGQLLAKGDPRGPVCVDCHSAHSITKPTEHGFKSASDQRCGRCHKDRLARYRETYHGRAIALGSEKVAACYDCHGHHNVVPVSDPSSPLAPANIVATCRQCHQNANAKFAQYEAHGDHSDKVHYPILYWTYVAMTGLLLSVFAFFGLHTLLWFIRSGVLMIRNPKAFKEAREHVRQEKEGKVFVRFSPVDRFCHFLVIVSFLLLVLTGMPLKFYYTGWAQAMFNFMGGPSVAAALHRVGAFLTGVYFAVHISTVVSALWRHRADYRNESGSFSVKKLLGFVFGPDSPLPNYQDLKDFVAHQKWFFGRGPRPQFDRWTYWEKFDYLAVFWGVFVIGMSGLVMWFPTTATLVMPGWAINVAHVLHSDEALLAAGFIFTFHFFNVHFRIEKFPMDPVIFSGRITEAEMLHERQRLYDRLKAAGTLDEERVGDEWVRWKKIFTPIGMLAFTIGVALVVGIYFAMATRMLGHD